MSKIVHILKDLEDRSRWERERRLTLELVLEHLIQSQGRGRDQFHFRARLDRLEQSYRKIVEEANKDDVVIVDMSPGLAERYGIQDE